MIFSSPSQKNHPEHSLRHGVAKIAPSQISYPGNKKGPAIGVDRGAALFLVAMRAVGAAAAGGAGAGTAAALVGVVETAALKFYAAGRERLGGRSATARAHDLGGLGHGMLNLKHVAAARALVIVARHNTSFSAQSGQIALPA